MKKILYIFTLVLPLLFIACTSNGDEPDPVSPPAPLDPVTADNIIGEWQVYWASKLIRLNNSDPRTPMRDVSFDGFTVSIQKSGADIVYKEFNANKRITADGKIIDLKGDTAMVFRGWVKNGTHENPDTTIVFRPYIKKANQYMEISSTYWAYTVPKDTTWYQIIDRKLFRNQSNSISKDNYPGITKTLVDVPFLTSGSGKWKITSYTRIRKDASTNTQESLSEKEITTIQNGIYNNTTKSGAKYWFGTDMTFRSWLPDDRETESGTYRIYDDVISYFFDSTNTSGEPVEASATLLVTSKVITTSPNTFSEQTLEYNIIGGRLKIDTKSTSFARIE